MAMTSIKNADKRSGTVLASSEDAATYPEGTCICLEEEVLVKLGVTGLPPAGSEVTFTARAFVKSASLEAEAAEPDEAEPAEKEREVELQITHLDLRMGGTTTTPTLYDRS